MSKATSIAKGGAYWRSFEKGSSVFILAVNQERPGLIRQMMEDGADPCADPECDPLAYCLLERSSAGLGPGEDETRLACAAELGRAYGPDRLRELAGSLDYGKCVAGARGFLEALFVEAEAGSWKKRPRGRRPRAKEKGLALSKKV